MTTIRRVRIPLAPKPAEPLWAPPSPLVVERELQHYGFLVQTKGASLGVNGKGKSPHWRITDRPTRKDNNELCLATKDFLHWDGVVFEPHVRPSRRWNARKQGRL